MKQLGKYERPESYNDLKCIKVLFNVSCRRLLERLIFGQWSWFGYRNSLSTKRRGFAALIQTLFATLGLGAVAALLFWLLPMVGIPLQKNDNGLDQQVYLGVVALVGAVFGGTWWKERKDVHEKWLYLAEVYNQMIATDPLDGDAVGYNKREHMRAAMAHDLLVMEMWAHRSFRDIFKEVVERAVAYKHAYEPSTASQHLEQIAAKGISRRDVNELICTYIEHLAPEVDDVDYYFRIANRNSLKTLK